MKLLRRVDTQDPDCDPSAAKMVVEARGDERSRRDSSEQMRENPAINEGELVRQSWWKINIDDGKYLINQSGKKWKFFSPRSRL